MQRWFLPDEAEAIRDIALCSIPSPDKLVWRMTPRGDYTVRSGTWLTTEVGFNSLGVSIPSSSSFSDTWKKIWKLSCLPKIRHFVWNIMNNALATGENMGKKGIGFRHYSLCHYLSKSSIHLFFQCPFANQVWMKVCYPTVSLSQQLPSVPLLLARVIDGWSTMEASRFCLIMWGIWQA